MENPGLSAFADAPVMEKPRVRSWADDPDVDEDEEDRADPVYTPPPYFRDRAHSQGYATSERIPTVVGEPYAPWQNPKDVIQGELVAPDEDSWAQTKTPGAEVAVHTLSHLLGGGTSSGSAMQTAHDFLSQHFRKIRVNPEQGVAVAEGHDGSRQVMQRHEAPSGVPAEDTYTLTNNHGTFEVPDRDKPDLVRSMVAFQIATNGFGLLKKKKDDQDNQQNNGLGTTSGLRDWFRMDPEPMLSPAAKQHASVPGAVFEKGLGSDAGPYGQVGGWVAHPDDAPADWHRDPVRPVAYSPNHVMRNMLVPEEAMKPRRDPRPGMGGYTYTYSANPDTRHTIPRVTPGGTQYFVNTTHPAFRDNFDVPKALRAPKGPRPRPSSRMPGGAPKTLTTHPDPLSGGGTTPHTGAVMTNDLCPVCASGYLEPYDRDFHECLNCGSLVKANHVGYTAAARPKGGLGRRLQDIPDQVGDPLNLAAGGSGDPNKADEPLPTAEYHPLHGVQLQRDQEAEVYQAPTQLREKGQVRRPRTASNNPGLARWSA